MFLMIVLLLFPPLALAAGAPALSFWTVDGGGGMSTGGAFTLFGSIGQPEAGTMAGGGLALVGGFWSGSGPSGASNAIYLPLILR